MILNSLLSILRWIRDKKYYFTKGLFKTSYGFSLWSHKRPRNNKIISSIELETLKKYIYEVECFIDIGAFIGFFSVYTKKINSKLKIYSFEPHPQNYKLLEKNYELNNLDKNNLFNIGLSDKKGYEKLYGFGQGASLLPNWGGISNFGINIYLKTLNDYCDHFKDFKKGIFIKIDAEGNEAKILIGSNKILSLNIPIIIMYENSIKKNYTTKNENFLKTHKILHDNGFKTYNISDLSNELNLDELNKLYNEENDSQINFLAIKN